MGRGNGKKPSVASTLLCRMPSLTVGLLHNARTEQTAQGRGMQ